MLAHSHPPDSTTTEETALTIGANVFSSLFSHVFCCGLLPMAVNASASALLSSLGMQIGFAVLTTCCVAGGVTLFEKRRHQTACRESGHCGCAHEFNFRRHFLCNLAIGAVIYSMVYGATHLPAIHVMLEKYFGI